MRKSRFTENQISTSTCFNKTKTSTTSAFSAVKFSSAARAAFQRSGINGRFYLS
jgi:hypothetical protein